MIVRVRFPPSETLVLSHGLGDDVTTWSALLPLLRQHRAVTWELRGHGANVRTAEAPADEYAPELAIADLLDVVHRADDRVHLIGHSLGGYLSLAVALRRPELVASLTLIASGPGYRDPAAREAWNRSVEQAILRMPVPPAAARLAHQHDSWVIDHVAELRAPLLVVVGERDQRFHPGAAYLGRAVHGTVVRYVRGAGHHPQQTHPDEVAEAVLGHVAAAGVAANDEAQR